MFKFLAFALIWLTSSGFVLNQSAFELIFNPPSKQSFGKDINDLDLEQIAPRIPSLKPEENNLRSILQKFTGSDTYQLLINSLNTFEKNNSASLRRKLYESSLNGNPVGWDVLIIGSGPSALKAASVASAKGYSVGIFETKFVSGGNFKLAGNVIANNATGPDDELLALLARLPSKNGGDIRPKGQGDALKTTRIFSRWWDKIRYQTLGDLIDPARLETQLDDNVDIITGVEVIETESFNSGVVSMTLKITDLDDPNMGELFEVEGQKAFYPIGTKVKEAPQGDFGNLGQIPETGENIPAVMNAEDAMKFLRILKSFNGALPRGFLRGKKIVIQGGGDYAWVLAEALSVLIDPFNIPDSIIIVGAKFDNARSAVLRRRYNNFLAAANNFKIIFIPAKIKKINGFGNIASLDLEYRAIDAFKSVDESLWYDIAGGIGEGQGILISGEDGDEIIAVEEFGDDYQQFRSVGIENGPFDWLITADGLVPNNANNLLKGNPNILYTDEGEIRAAEYEGVTVIGSGLKYVLDVRDPERILNRINSPRIEGGDTIVENTEALGIWGPRVEQTVEEALENFSPSGVMPIMADLRNDFYQSKSTQDSSVIGNDYVDVDRLYKVAKTLGTSNLNPKNEIEATVLRALEYELGGEYITGSFNVRIDVNNRIVVYNIEKLPDSFLKRVISDPKFIQMLIDYKVDTIEISLFQPQSREFEINLREAVRSSFPKLFGIRDLALKLAKPIFTNLAELAQEKTDFKYVVGSKTITSEITFK